MGFNDGIAFLSFLKVKTIFIGAEHFFKEARLMWLLIDTVYLLYVILLSLEVHYLHDIADFFIPINWLQQQIVIWPQMVA